MTKPKRKADEQTLRAMIGKMPPDVAKIVRAACQKHGLLPGGGGNDKPKGKG